jgi:hypothetical protein
MEVHVMHSGSRFSLTGVATSVGALFLVVTSFGCAGVKAPGADSGGGGNGGGGVHPGAGGHIVQPCTGPNGKCTDFPTAPIVDQGVSTSFCASPSNSGGPCILEPQDGSLFPSNWLRPRVNASGISGPMKVTVHADMEANDLVVYTSGNVWAMPKDIWVSLASHVQDAPITISVCGTNGAQSTSTITIAPAQAAGSMVFWAANPAFADIDEHTCQTAPTPNCQNVASLLGFSVGDETVEPVLGIGQVAQQSKVDNGAPATVTCIGCHSATPDKGFVTFVDSYPWRTATASVEGATGMVPSGMQLTPAISASGLATLLQPGWGPFAFSLNKSGNNPYWQPGTMRIGIGALGLQNPLSPDYSNLPDSNDSPHLAWFNLDGAARPHQDIDQGNWAYANFDPTVTDISSGKSLGFIPHNGDLCGNVPCGAGMPTWSHDGKTIVYVSTNAAQSGRFNMENPDPPKIGGAQAVHNAFRLPGLTNLYSVPFNNGNGGTATPIAGAASNQFEEYYPALSSDDSMVAFTSVPAGQAMYANPSAEISVVPTMGGAATRLKANDPPSCSGKSSPGVNNHWSKWSPEVASGPKGKYYWMIFSSNRAGLPPVASSAGRPIQISQLYLAPILIGGEQFTVTTYPAIYLWNQPTNSVNTTPAWETFDIPVIGYQP